MSWNKYFAQEPISFIFEQTIFIHDFIILFGILIMFVLFMIVLTSKLYSTPVSTFPGQIDKLEMVWTISPLMILILIMVPSIRMLMVMEEPIPSMISMKIMAHQWYWTYQYTNSDNITESVMTNPSTVKPFYLLEVDNRAVLPYNTPISILVSSNDVIHSWAVPALGLKVDAMPGRINRVNIYSEKPGVFWGQCSEICGVNHSFMPIVVEFINMKSIIKLFNLNYV